MTAPLSPRPPSSLPCGPRVWDPVRDPAFFRIVARLFPPATTSAMSVLLAANDREDDGGTTPVVGSWSSPALVNR